MHRHAQHVWSQRTANAKLRAFVWPAALRLLPIPEWTRLSPSLADESPIPGAALLSVGLVEFDGRRIAVAMDHGGYLFSLLYEGTDGSNPDWRHDTTFSDRPSYLAVREEVAYAQFFAVVSETFRRRPPTPRYTPVVSGTRRHPRVGLVGNS